MYTVDSKDTVIELTDVAPPDAGAPMPVVWADDCRLILQYIASQHDPDWDGTYAKEVSPESTNQCIAVVRFVEPYAHMFGPPNDEAFNGHPLASRGLSPYAVSEVKESSWIRQLEKMNSVHPRHDRSRFLRRLRHFVFAFHDSTFECIADHFTITFEQGSLKSSLERILKVLKADGT